MQNPEKLDVVLLTQNVICLASLRACLSDKELYEKCSFFGTRARKWANKFAALLPEVERRALYKKHGFYSIFEFAAKLARMNRETVIEILRISKRLKDMPLLWGLIETQGWSKLRVVATIATKENEKMLAEKICQMSKSTLATFVNEIKKQNAKNSKFLPGEDGCKNIESQNSQLHGQVDRGNSQVLRREGQANPQQNLLDCRNVQFQEQVDQAKQENRENAQQNLPNCENSEFQLQSSGHSRIHVRLLLKPKTELRLKELQKKLSKKIGAPVDLNEVMETLLDAYDGRQKRAGKAVAHKSMAAGNAAATKSATDSETITKSANVEKLGDTITRPSRYISIKIKKVLYSKYGGRCAFPCCTKLPDICHHTRRFALNPNHDPDFLTPLCKAHEQLAHHGLIENEEKPAENWRLQLEPDKSVAKYWVDRKVRGFRGPLKNYVT